MEYLLHILIIVNIFIPLALSLDLVVGRTGILSILHAGMYGLGAYVTAVSTKIYGLSFSTSVLIGIIITACFAYALSRVFSRLKGDYYALGSLGASIILFSLFMNLTGLTGGPVGIANIPPPSFFSVAINEKISFFFFSLLVMGILYGIVHILTSSRFGLIIQAIRDESLATKVFGYRVESYKNAVFVMAAVMASIVGSVYATYISFINPFSFTLNESILMLTMIIIGGLASKRGAIFGAVFVIVLPELLRFVGLPDSIGAQLRLAIYGAIILYLMYKKPTGLFGHYTP